ncbi:MAG: GntR family transcriptional regulator [Alphaproteobacteria bacterium]|nr:GntR family transcriptional regulator [Alphaproteobacteria bacterium]MCW5743948.1 GntR family transcriptional regulator [Alphaproteobacteria bacterium]
MKRRATRKGAGSDAGVGAWAAANGRGRRPGHVPVLASPPLVEALRLLIAGRGGHPCPDNRLLAEALGVRVVTVRDALDLLEAAGELEIQRSAYIGGLRRRMRVKVAGRWRRWTALGRRGAYDLRITAPDLLHGPDTHHLVRVLMAGKYD